MSEPTEKLKIMTETCDGFVIAQKDMELRGAGEIFGLRQSGESQSPLTAINDAKLLKEIHDAARRLLKDAASKDAQRVIEAAQEALKKKMNDVGMN